MPYNPNMPSPERVTLEKISAVLDLLVRTTEGPGEGYAVLVACIHHMNFFLSSEPITIDELVLEVSRSLRSVTRVHMAN